MENNQNSSCPTMGCGCVGYAYVPIQLLQETCTPEVGLKAGTIFPELSLDICEYGKVCKQVGGVM